MLMRIPILPVLGLLLAGNLAVAEPQAGPDVEVIDASDLPANRRFPASDVVFRRRPWVAEDDGGTLLVENLVVRNVTNQKAIDIALTSNDRVPGKVITFGKVHVRNVEVENVFRDEVGQKQGLHIDFLRIVGGGDDQPRPTDVLIENYTARNGNALPLIIQDGLFDTITLRNVRVEKTQHGVQIGMINTGRVKTLVIEDSPGLRVAIMGRPGAIGTCIVKNSPGAVVTDELVRGGRSGVRIQGGERRPATTTAAERPTGPRMRLQVDVDRQTGKVKATLLGDVPADTLFVSFEVLDRDNYLMVREIIATTAPYTAEGTLKRSGRFRVRATVRLMGGDTLDPVEADVDFAAP